MFLKLNFTAKYIWGRIICGAEKSHHTLIDNGIYNSICNSLTKDRANGKLYGKANCIINDTGNDLANAIANTKDNGVAYRAVRA